MYKCSKPVVWNFEFSSLEFIYCLVLVIWYLSRIWIIEYLLKNGKEIRVKVLI